MNSILEQLPAQIGPGGSVADSTLPWQRSQRSLCHALLSCHLLSENLFSGTQFGVWRSLVARLLREQKAAGSNPVTPTNYCL